MAVAAPLLIGGVHRASAIGLLATTVIGLTLVTIGNGVRAQSLRLSPSTAVFVLLVAIPLCQAIPLPLRLRAAIDPKGSALLAELTHGTGLAPLSLDPPATWVDMARAALALAIFIVAFHLASGQRRRHLLPRAVGLAAVTAVAIGITHKFLGLEKIYGLVASTPRTLLIGPFVNANHTAEFLELGAFSCLACSFQRPSILNRVCWLTGTALCAGGVAATLSRGGVAALGAGILSFVFARRFGKTEASQRSKHGALAWGALLLGLVVLGFLALGVDQLVQRFETGSIAHNIRFRVWRDSLKVLSAHPFGIGRGAFDRVYPIYRTVKTPFALHFAFVENEPLQLLIDCGWLMTGSLILGFGLLAWDVGRGARRDRMEAALVAGLVAVLVHNLVDFGLETPGVALPFVAILATVLGRARSPRPDPRPWISWGAVGLAGVTCLIGILALSRSSADDFDSLLKEARNPTERSAVLVRARAAHPVDYFYALAYASLEPLRGRPGQPSPRFHSLNEALLLCPGCETIHLRVAENLWSLGLRQQALLEYRSAVELQGSLFRSVIGELFNRGATPAQLASIATFDPEKMIELAQYLGSIGRAEDALSVLAQAETYRAPKRELLLARAALFIQLGRQAPAEASIASLKALHAGGPRLALLEARALLLAGGDAAPDRALGILETATARYPNDVDLQRLRVDLITRYEKWATADRALEGYRRALYARDGMATEAHLASARISTKMGRWTDAISEYRIALADQPTDVALWMELARISESAGRMDTAREAYSMAARLSPNNPEASRGLQRLQEARRAFLDQNASSGVDQGAAPGKSP